MNSFQVMHFVDKASPQQLQQMVAARDPYSYMALAKLQSIRDDKLKADAKQPESPPLSQVIPQQIAQLENKGIASLPQQAPQMPPAGMPPQMPPQQPPMQAGIGPAMAPAGAAGGLVSFKHGGIAHFYSGGNDELTNIYLGGLSNVLTPEYIRGKKNPEYNKPVIPADNKQTPTPVATNPTQPGAYVYTPPTAGDAGSKGIRDFQTSQAGDAPQIAAPTATQGKPTATPGGGFGLPSRGEVDRAIKSESDFYENVLKEQVPKLAFNKAKYDTAAGDVTADTKRIYEQQQKDFPDPNKDFRIELSKLKQANEDEGKQIPHMAMLKMGLSLMSTKSPNFLQAFGEAGGAGLEDYTKAINLQKQSKIKLMEADAHAASAQDARSQNMFGRANSQAMQDKQSRMEAFRAEADANAATVGLQVQYLGAKAKLPLDSIKMQRELAVAGAQIHQAYKEQKPEMQKLYELVSTNPGFAKFFQTQKDAAEIKDISDNIIAAHSRAVKIAEDGGKEPPDKNKFYNEWMSTVLNARRATQEPSNSLSPLRPINFGSQPQQNMPFFNNFGSQPQQNMPFFNQPGR
jgi:hypothetical protein